MEGPFIRSYFVSMGEAIDSDSDSDSEPEEVQISRYNPHDSWIEFQQYMVRFRKYVTHEQL